MGRGLAFCWAPVFFFSNPDKMTRAGLILRTDRPILLLSGVGDRQQTTATKGETMTTATDITGHGRNYRYRGLQICRIDNTKARNWHVFGGHTGCAILFRCNSLESAQRYADARIETAARDAIAAAEAKLGKGHELTCQRAIHSLGWDQDGEQAEQLVRIYQGRA